jgi:hypothetical protein
MIAAVPLSLFLSLSLVLYRINNITSHQHNHEFETLRGLSPGKLPESITYSLCYDIISMLFVLGRGGKNL